LPLIGLLMLLGFAMSTAGSNKAQSSRQQPPQKMQQKQEDNVHLIPVMLEEDESIEN
jgi:hypothetical protein